MVFQVDDKPIPRVDTLTVNSSSQSSSIALALQVSKQKQETEPTDQPSIDIMLLTTGFKKVITILDNVYCAFQSSQRLEPSIVLVVANKALEKRLDQIEVNIQNIANKILHIPTFSPSPPANNDTLKKKVSQIKNDIESMGGKML